MASAYLTIWTNLSNYKDLFNDHTRICTDIEGWLYDDSLAIAKPIYLSNEQYDRVVGITFLYEETGEEADVYNKIKNYLNHKNTIILSDYFQFELIPKADGDYKKWINDNDILKEEYKANYNPSRELSRFVSPSIGIQLTHLQSKTSVLCNYDRSRFANLENAEPFLYSKVKFVESNNIT